MKKFILASFILSVSNAQAQKLSFDNVVEITMRNVGAIKQADQVKGYYFFYESDKITKRTNEYTLQVTDDKLKKLKELKFQDKEDVVVQTSSFNGSDLLFLFHHLSDNKVKYKIFGADGAAKWDYETVAYVPMLPSGMPSGLAEGLVREAIGTLYPIEGKGFISKRTHKGGKSFELNFYSTKTKKTWTYMPSGGKFLSGTYLGATDRSVLLTVYKLSGMFDRNPEVSLVSVDIETGKVLFEKATDQAGYKFIPSVMYGAGGSSAFVVGEYFDPKQSMVKDKSKGVVLLETDEKGAVLKQKQISWENIFAKRFAVSERGKIEGFGYLFIHDVIRLADGAIHIVGEGYTVEGAKTFTTDMMTLQFDKDFSLVDMQLFSKQANAVGLDGGGAFMSNQTKGYVMKFENKFDYAYMLKNSTNNSYSVYFSDFVRNKQYKGGTFNSITYSKNKFSTDKINTKTDATFSAILPAVQGQILMLDYYKKDKRLDTHFEKMN